MANIDLQKKFRYKCRVTINSTGVVYSPQIDEFTPSGVRTEAVTRQNRKMGQMTQVGPKTYDEVTFRLTLRIGDSTVSDLVDAFEDLNDNDTDTCDIFLQNLAVIGGEEKVSYTQTFQNCRLTSYKLDNFGRKMDDDFVHIEIMVVPTKVFKTKKVEIA